MHYRVLQTGFDVKGWRGECGHVSIYDKSELPSSNSLLHVLSLMIAFAVLVIKIIEIKQKK